MRRQRQKRQRTPVEHPIEHHAKRIDVHAFAIRLVVIDLRCDKVRRSRARACHRPLRSLGNAEISELIVTGIRHQDVIRLDVSVDDPLFPAEAKRFAQIHTKFYGLFRCDLTAKIFFERREQFHFDENVPPDAVFVLHGLKIVTPDDVDPAFELQHELVLVEKPLHLLPVAIDE